ncbi:MAG: DUF4136 domain-containing protein [Cyclobacteriaceae bacterium]
MMYRFFIMFVVVFFSACSPLKVKVYYDERFEFEDLKTFCWMSGCEFNIQGPSSLSGDTSIVHSFMKEIKSHLIAKGYEYNDETPDFLINLHVVAFEKKVGGYTPYHIYGRENDFTPFLSEDSYQYLEGSLIIDIANYKTSTVVWRSDVIGYTDSGKGFSEKTIKHVIYRALRQFPPE